MTRFTPASVRAFAAYRAAGLRHRASLALDPLRDRHDPDRRRYFPDDPDQLTGYRDRFDASARVLDPFLARSADIRNGDRDPVAVVVMPWFGTPSPWYAIALGLGLARQGRRVTFVWHDLPFPGRQAAHELQNAAIGRALRRLGDRFDIVRASRVTESIPGADDAAVAADLAAQNATWFLRAATDLLPRERGLEERMRASLARDLPRVRALVRRGGFDLLVVSGGVLLGSGCYMQAARDQGVRAATFDAGLGWTVVCTDGVAAQQTDLTRAFDMLRAELGDDTDAVVTAAREEYERRRLGSDATSYQQASAAGAATGGPRTVLVPLSVMFDTAALGRHHLFADSREWLVETVDAARRATDDPIVVRQHPSERRVVERSRFDAGAIVAEAFGDDPQVRFLPAEDPTNTYDILDRSHLVLPFVSTIGIEAAALGVPVVVGGRCYYSDMGFVWSASTRDEYAALVARGARGELPVLPDQTDRAWTCYYLNAVCQRVWTDFTAQPPDYWRWVARHPDELFADPQVRDILTALDDDVPLPILRHRRFSTGGDPNPT